jgi:hypothetical protein
MAAAIQTERAAGLLGDDLALGRRAAKGKAVLTSLQRSRRSAVKLLTASEDRYEVRQPADGIEFPWRQGNEYFTDGRAIYLIAAGPGKAKAVCDRFKWTPAGQATVRLKHLFSSNHGAFGQGGRQIAAAAESINDAPMFRCGHRQSNSGHALFDAENRLRWQLRK